MINESFQNMWALASDDSPLLKFSKKVKGVGELAGNLKAPNLFLQAVPGPSIPLLYYKLRFSSGTLMLYVSDDDDDDTTKTWDMTVWDLIFPVNIGRVAPIS